MNDDLKSDFAYIKTLAEEGRDTPLVNGAMHVLWGSIIGATAFIVYLDVIGVISLGPARGVWPWLTAIVGGWICSFIIGPRVSLKPGASTLGNKTTIAVWFAVGCAITSFWLTLMVVHDNFTAYGIPAYFLFNLMFPVAFLLVSVSFFATAVAGRLTLFKWFAGLALLFSCVSMAFLGSPHQLLVGGIGIILCSVAPGLILMRKEPSDIV